GAVGLRARPVPDPGVRRHGGLRPDQGPLLRGPPRHQSDRHRPGGPRLGQLADTAPPGGARRSALRRRDAARAGAAPGERGPADRVSYPAVDSAIVIDSIVTGRSGGTPLPLGLPTASIFSMVSS